MPVNIKYIGKHIENVSKQSEEEGSSSPYFSIDQARMFRPIFGYLNEKDRDILYLIFVSRKKQKDVQRILGRSQPSLCYDIKRIRKRLKFIVYLHSVFDIFLNFIRSEEVRRLEYESSKTFENVEKGCEEQVNDLYFTAEELEILALMFFTSSFTQTSRKMRVSQVKVRYAYNKCVKRMELLEIWEAYEIFTVIRNNLNIVKRTYRSDRKSSSSTPVIFI